jgi:predicted  nucleic acid-binding Zn-ribbon protein
LEDDIAENVKQAASSSEDAAEQPSIKISAEGLDAEIHVLDEQDLETVLANLELLARRKGLDTEILSRSVEGHRQQDVLHGSDRDLLGWLEQLDEDIGAVEEHLQSLDQRVDRVEDELGGGEDSQLADIMDRIQELDESIEDMPDDVSRHLGELREQIQALEYYVEDVEEHATSLDEDMEAFRQRISEVEAEGSEEDSDERFEQVEEDVDDEHEIDEQGDEQDFITSEDVQEARDIRRQRKQEESGSEGLYSSVEEFRQLSTDERGVEIKEIIWENPSITVAEIGKHLFGEKPGWDSTEYKEIHNRISSTIDDVEEEKNGRSVAYRLPKTDDHESFESSGTTTEVEEGEGAEKQVSSEPEAEPVESESGGDEDREFSDHDGRYSLEELRENEDLSVKAEVLKVFQEYRKHCGAISIPEATQVLFGFEASENDEEYQVVLNHLETHSRKEGERVKDREQEDGETQYEVYGPFKFCNLYYDTHHEVICTQCPLGEAVYTSRKAKKHHINTRNDGMKEHHNSFVSAQIPDNFKNGETVRTIIQRECGNE